MNEKMNLFIIKESLKNGVIRDQDLTVLSRLNFDYENMKNRIYSLNEPVFLTYESCNNAHPTLIEEIEYLVMILKGLGFKQIKIDYLKNEKMGKGELNYFLEQKLPLF